MSSSQLIENLSQKKFPDFIAVGPQKTGTTWMYSLLKQSSRVCFPKNVKETMFFELYYEEGLERYLSYFSDYLPGQLCGEVAPSYFDVPEIPRRIHRINPDCKVIISLRHPADRAFSLYLHHLRKGRVGGSLLEAVHTMPRILEAGNYRSHIERWLDIFGQEQVLFVLMDDIKDSPRDTLFKIYEFLSLPLPDSLENPALLSGKVNAAGMPRSFKFAQLATFGAGILRKNRLDRVVEFLKKLGLKKAAYSGGEAKMPELASEDLEYLSDLYKEDVEFVENLLQRPLTHWRIEGKQCNNSSTSS